MEVLLRSKKWHTNDHLIRARRVKEMPHFQIKRMCSDFKFLKTRLNTSVKNAIKTLMIVMLKIYGKKSALTLKSNQFSLRGTYHLKKVTQLSSNHKKKTWSDLSAKKTQKTKTRLKDLNQLDIVCSNKSTQRKIQKIMNIVVFCLQKCWKASRWQVITNKPTMKLISNNCISSRFIIEFRGVSGKPKRFHCKCKWHIIYSNRQSTCFTNHPNRLWFLNLFIKDSSHSLSLSYKRDISTVKANQWVSINNQLIFQTTSNIQWYLN